MNDFKDQYRDQKWYDKKREILRRDCWRCRVCHITKVALDVHHLYYNGGVKIWEYDNDVLVSLCRECHIKIHEDLKKVSGLIAFKLLSSHVDMLELDQKIDEIINNGEYEDINNFDEFKNHIL